MFKLKKLMKKNTVVHCPKQSQAMELLAWADSKGLTWCNSDSYLTTSNNWYVDCEATCYNLVDGGHSPIDFYEEEGYKVLSFKEAKASKKPMSTLTYMKKKNKILKKLTGITLIPKDQLVSLEATYLSIESDSAICPHCIAYGKYNCKDCPMAIAGNKCSIDEDNTYDQIIDALPSNYYNIYQVPAIKKLVKKFNKQFD